MSGNTNSGEVSLRTRLLSLPWLKSIGPTLAISSFFVAYFWVLRAPLFEVRVMPVFAVDRWIPVVPFTAWIYFSLWVYICLPVALMHRRSELGVYFSGALLLSLVGLSVFLLWPSAVPEWPIDWSVYPILEFLKTSDASGNACPSLHVGFSVYAGLWMVRMLRVVGAARWIHGLNVVWALLIIVSTLTTKQHVLIDVIAGVGLGAFIYGVNQVAAKKAGWSHLRSKAGKEDSIGL